MKQNGKEKNMFQMKEQYNKHLRGDKNHKWYGENNLPDKKFKVMIITMLNKLVIRMVEHMELQQREKI